MYIFDTYFFNRQLNLAEISFLNVLLDLSSRNSLNLIKKINSNKTQPVDQMSVFGP
jgi:hypothetical protein